MYLIKLAHVSNGTLAKLGKNSSVSWSIVNKVCLTFRL